MVSIGEFPSRYRPIIYRFLLRFPENSDAFTDLAKRGTHPAYQDLYAKYPVQSKSIFTRLQNLCSQLAHWCPVLGDAPYLPAMVFPFVILFGNDELAALELSMTLMMWWGHSWHAAHPNPPVHILDGLDALLKFHDLKLHTHLHRLGVSIGILGWAMISSLFTEVLCRNDWFRLMDFLFCYFDEISYLLLVPIALFRELKTSLLTSDTATKVTHFCRTQQGVNMNTVIVTLKELLHATPPKYLTAVSTRFIDNASFETGPKSLHKDVDFDGVDEARENLALASGKPVFPLPKYRYPVYDGYPIKMFDLQIKERERVMALTQEVSRREGVLRALEKKLLDAEADHRRWIEQHTAASEQEMKYQQSLMIQEKLHLRELHRIEEEISMQRIKALSNLEHAEKEEMAVMDKIASDAQALLLETEKHMKEKMDISLEFQKHRELAEKAELATQEKLRQMRLLRARDDWVKGMAGMLKSKEGDIAAGDATVQERWRKEDDDLRAARQMRMDQLRRMEEDDKLVVLQLDMDQRLQRLQADRDAKIREIERARAVRMAKEAADEALEAAARSAAALRRQEIETVAQRKAVLSTQAAVSLEEKLVGAVNAVNAESSRLIDAERVYRLKEAQAQRAAREAQLQEEWTKKSSSDLKTVVTAQNVLHEQALKLKQAALRNEAAELAIIGDDRSSAATQSAAVGGSGKSSRGDNQTRAEIEALGDNVLRQQRERFAEMQQFLDEVGREQLLLAAAAGGGRRSVQPAQQQQRQQSADSVDQAAAAAAAEERHRTTAKVPVDRADSDTSDTSGGGNDEGRRRNDEQQQQIRGRGSFGSSTTSAPRFRNPDAQNIHKATAASSSSDGDNNEDEHWKDAVSDSDQ
jgi:hypothetical protein